jgi:hypothetical protein
MDTSFSLNNLSPKLLHTIRLAHLEGYGSSRYLYDISQSVDFASKGSYNFETLQLICLKYLYRGVCVYIYIYRESKHKCRKSNLVLRV